MGISLRHHVLSLVAVFLMLLVGLLVGVGLSGDPELQQKTLDLNEQFTELMDENAAFSRAARAQEKFAREALPRLVAHKLDGRSIAVLVTSQPEDNASVSDIVDALTVAGARVPYWVVLRKGFGDRAASAFPQANGRAEAFEKAAQAIAGHVAKADEGGLHTLKRRGLIHIRGRVGSSRPSMAVIIGGAEAGAEPLDEALDGPLIEALIAAGIDTIVGCEDSPEVSYTETYRELGISTVDNVDLVRGRFSLIMVLAGQPGNYGDGPSAEEFAPLE